MKEGGWLPTNSVTKATAIDDGDGCADEGGSRAAATVEVGVVQEVLVSDGAKAK